MRSELHEAESHVDAQLPRGGVKKENTEGNKVAKEVVSSGRINQARSGVPPVKIHGVSAHPEVQACRSHLSNSNFGGTWACTGVQCTDTNRAYAAALQAANHPFTAPIPDSTDEEHDEEPETCVAIPSEGALAQSDACFNPKTADPSGWCCDCLARVQATCGGVDDECFRQFMCNHPKVDKDWKARDGQCTTNQVDRGCSQVESESSETGFVHTPQIQHDPAGRLVRQDFALMERQHSVASAAKVQDSGLDEALEDKCSSCSR